MKKLILMIFVSIVTLSAQSFTVEKISGNVFKIEGTNEELVPVKRGEVLTADDLIVTEPNSYIQLNNNNNRFLLESNSALELNYIKKISINDLLLRLAMEEIRNVPKNNADGEAKNTAVYGDKISDDNNIITPSDLLGLKKLNGAKQLAESGYQESAIIVAKETFRKHPVTRNDFGNRIFLADLLMKVELYAEAGSEYQSILQLDLEDQQHASVKERLKEINIKAGSN